MAFIGQIAFAARKGAIIIHAIVDADGHPMIVGLGPDPITISRRHPIEIQLTPQPDGGLLVSIDELETDVPLIGKIAKGV